MNRLSERERGQGLKLEPDLCGRRPAEAKQRGEFERIVHASCDRASEFVRLLPAPYVHACKKTASLFRHHVGDVRIGTSRKIWGKLSKVMQDAFWLKVVATDDIGVSTRFLKRSKNRMKCGFLTTTDHKFVGDVIALLCLEPAKTSKVPGKLDKRTQDNLHKFEGQGMMLYRKAAWEAYILEH